MNIVISEELLEAAINSKVKEGMESALSSYRVKEAIEEKLTAEVTCGLIGNSLSLAIQKIDTQELTNKLSIEIQRAMVSAVSHILHEGLASLIIDLRKIPDYDREKREKEYTKILTLLNRS